MSPEEKQQFEDLQKRVIELENVQGIDFIGNLKRRLIVSQLTEPEIFDDTGITGILDTNENLRTTTVTITIPSGGGTGTSDITHLDAPDNFLTYKYNDETYKIWANKI